MSIELKMPALSPTMEKGMLARWLVKEGDMVRIGDMVAEIETDKATMELESESEGRVARLLVDEGTDDIAVGTAIALLAEEGEATPRPVEPVKAPVQVQAPALAPVSAADAATAVPLDDRMLMSARDADANPANANATPLARRVAEIKDIALSGIKGSGARGKIVIADLGLPVFPAPAPTPAAVSTLTPTIAPPPEGVPVETVRLSTMRKTIARRLSQSKQTVPHFYLTARCNLDPLLKLRSEINAGLETHGIKLSVNDVLIKAMAIALIDVPDANVQFGGDELHRFGRADISVAVAIGGGLVTPVIKGADSLSLSAIAQQSKTLAAKARDGKLRPEEYQGGTASISNLGMFGIDEMFPVINPPQAVILGIGAGIAQPWNVDGKIALATIISATASFDHRAIDGAVAARFMATFRGLIENPMTILGR